MGPLPPLRGRFDRVQEMLSSSVGHDVGPGGSPGTAEAARKAHQRYIIQILTATFSAISTASALLSFYWFRRMRRSFRHDLIMLLIQSDMFKALWFMIFPVVVFITGPVPDSSTFCKVNGFFISLGIEASDFAVLMIAIHSALYIFKPRGSSGEGGLYPYRHTAFALWIILPLLSASLAFINHPNSYVNQAAYCYLPVRPFWYRLALSWIPRYIIFIVILVIYASIYLYVRYKFRGFGEGSTRENQTTSQISLDGRPMKTFDLPVTPQLAYNGLISGSAHNSYMSQKSQANTRSTIDSDRSPRNSQPQDSIGPWQKIALARPASESTLQRPSQIPTLSSRASAPEINDQSPRLFFHQRLRSRFTSISSSRSVMGIRSFLRLQPQHPSSTSRSSTATSSLELVNSRGENLAAREMAKQRDKIRKQLRFLFIYPLVYIGMWVLPFVGHAMHYSERYALELPFALSAIINVVVTSQCAVDCWVFSSRERPWRQIPGSKGGFWESFAWWRRGDEGSGGRESRIRGVDTMKTEARAAYRRRDEEMAARESEMEISGGARKVVTERSWWDHDGDRSLMYNGMSRLVEESNPMKRVAIVEEPNAANQMEFSTKAANDPRDMRSAKLRSQSLASMVGAEENEGDIIKTAR